MHCHVYGRLYWDTAQVGAPGWRLDVYDPPGVITTSLAIPAAVAPFSPPLVPSKNDVTYCIGMTLQRSYEAQMAEKIWTEQQASLPAYDFIATYSSP